MERAHNEEGENLDLHRFEVDRRLKCLLPHPLPPREKRLWLAMSEGQRERAMERMKAIVRWFSGRRPLSPSSAAAAAGLKTNHFYEMAKAWQNAPSLVAVETSAAAPRTRTSDYEAALTRHVKAVVDTIPDGEKPVLKTLAEMLGEAAGEQLDKVPSFATLRRKVEEELRRRQRTVRPGAHIQFDVCLATISTLDHPHRMLFAIVDARTQLVLGMALGRLREARQGYASAAGDALRRLGSGSLRHLAWADRVENMELVAGIDDAGLDDDLTRIGVEVARAGIRPGIQPAIAAKRFGRYLRKAMGDRMGRVLLLAADSAASADVHSLDDLPGTSDDAARFQVEVQIHNSAILADLERDPAGRPPADLLAVLKMFEAWCQHGPD